MTDEPAFFADFRDLLVELNAAGAEFLIVGAHALAVHGIPRATGDLDVWVRPTPENATRVVLALRRFGPPLDAHGTRVDDFARTGTVYQLGVPPRRIDILTSISGVAFDTAWTDRIVVERHSLSLPVIGRDALLENKRASGRPKDLVDVAALERHKP